MLVMFPCVRISCITAIISFTRSYDAAEMFTKNFHVHGMLLTCHMPSPVCVIFSTDNVFLSFGGGSIFGGVCKITNSLNITDDPRLFVDVGGLNKLELAEFCYVRKILN
jgi:hypothetical protein